MKMLASWMQALYEEYTNQLHNFQPCDDHRLLLQSHAKETCRMLRGRLLNRQASFTIGFTESEALAFIQYWKLIPLMPGSLSQVTVAEIIQLIDKVAKAPRPMPLS